MHSLFGLKHLILIGVSVLLIVIGAIFAQKLSFKKITKALLGIGIVSEFIKIFYYIIRNEEKLGGVLPKTDLPLHLCSIQIIFILIVVLSKNEKLKRYVLSFMMPSCLFGGIAAILICPYSARNGLWIITAQYFLYHIAIIIFAIYLIRSKEIKFTIKDYVSSLVFIGILLFFSIYVNSILYDGVSDINFMYVVGPPQSGLPYLNKDNGWLVYMIHYATLIFVCITAVYIKPIIEYFKSKCSKKDNYPPKE